jgi:hypothetical protein
LPDQLAAEPIEAIGDAVSDQRLRALERRWRETNSSEDEAAYLLERVRVGDLRIERLELAAYCRHEGAQKAVRGYSADEEVSIDHWAEALGAWGQEALVIAIVVVASALKPGPASIASRMGRSASAIRAAAAWATCPCPAHAEECAVAEGEASDAFVDHSGEGEDDYRDAALQAARAATYDYETARQVIPQVVDLARNNFSPESIRTLLEAGLISWALAPRGRQPSCAIDDLSS